MRRLLAALLCALLAGPASATTYIAHINGSDTNCSGLVNAADPGSGTIPRPCGFRMPQKAVDTMACGDEALLSCGGTACSFTSSYMATWTDAFVVCQPAVGQCGNDWTNSLVFVHAANRGCSASARLTIRGEVDGAGNNLVTLDGENSATRERGIVIYDTAGVTIKDLNFKNLSGDPNVTASTGLLVMLVGCEQGAASKNCNDFEAIHLLLDNPQAQSVADNGGELVWKRGTGGLIKDITDNAYMSTGVLVYQSRIGTLDNVKIRRKRATLNGGGNAGETADLGMKHSSDITVKNSYLTTELPSYAALGVSPFELVYLRNSERIKFHRTIFENPWGTSSNQNFIKVQQDAAANTLNPDCNHGLGMNECFEQDEFLNDLFVTSMCTTVANEIKVFTAPPLNGTLWANNAFGVLSTAGGGCSGANKGHQINGWDGGGNWADPNNSASGHAIITHTLYATGANYRTDSFRNNNIIIAGAPTTWDCPTTAHGCALTNWPTLPSTDDLSGDPAFVLSGAKPFPYWQIQSSGVADNAGDNTRCAAPAPSDGQCDIGPFEIGGGAPVWTLTIQQTIGQTGSGSIDSTPAGIIGCFRGVDGTSSGTCTASFADQTAITLTATPTSGSVFSGWSGAGCGASITIVQDMTCTATFTDRCLDGVKDGTESDIDCSGGCSLCVNGKACVTGADCVSGYCDAVPNPDVCADQPPATPRAIKLVGGSLHGVTP